MKRIALLLALLPSPLTAQELSQTPPDEAAQHQAEREQHPERWRQTPWGRQWFHMTPTGEASLQRWDRGPTAHTGSQKRYLPNSTDDRYFMLSGSGRTDWYAPPSDPIESSTIKELRAEIARLESRLRELEVGR